MTAEQFLRDHPDYAVLDLMQEYAEQYANQKWVSVESIKRKIKLCSASISGALDGLQLDNTSDVIEKSIVIQQLKEQLNILNTK